MIIAIIKADYVSNYKIRFSFSDGIQRVIDFSNFLKSAKNPMTKKYLNKQLFKKYSVVYGDIVWNDYEMCFPILNLYEGTI